MAQQPNQPVRSIAKGEGDWVVETFSDPISNRPLKVTSYDENQLNMMLANIQAEAAGKEKMVKEMIKLLSKK